MIAEATRTIFGKEYTVQLEISDELYDSYEQHRVVMFAYRDLNNQLDNIERHLQRAFDMILLWSLDHDYLS